MKISKYSFLYCDNDLFYIYNSLSNSFLEIDQELYNALKIKQEQKSEIYENELDIETKELLLDKRIITNNDKDEFLLYKSIVERQRNIDNHMHLTIAPTMDCHFSCHYCYEKKEKKYMSDEVINSIVNHLQYYKNLSSIHLTWFGGEPLMAIDRMKTFYDEFDKVWDKKFTSNIITTGFLITPEVIETLKYIRVSKMQITLDGNKENHNKVKNTSICTDVFTKTIENVNLITELAPEIEISIRVNLTKENSNDFPPLLHTLLEKFKGKKVFVSPAFVLNRAVNKCDCDSNGLFNRKESSERILNLYNKLGIITPHLLYTTSFFQECGIRNKTALSVDPEGYIYKCWEIIGKKEYAIGKLIDGKVEDINIRVLNRQLYGADPLDDKTCSKCSYLPICAGGCPIQRIENEFEGKSNDVCTNRKGYMKDFLKAHLKIKKISTLS